MKLINRSLLEKLKKKQRGNQPLIQAIERLIRVRVERLITLPLPRRPVRADFPHTVPLNLVSLKDRNDIS